MATRGTQHPRRWTPAQLGTLSLWLDADDATTITVSTGVSQWNDKSGNGRNVSQSTGANQPSYVVNAQNGRHTVRFAGSSSQYLEGGDVLDVLAGGMSAAVVYKWTSGVVITKGRRAAAANGEWQLYANYMYLRAGAADRTSTSIGTSTAISVQAWLVDRTNGVASARNGDTPAFTGTGFPDTASYNTDYRFTVGGEENTGGGGLFSAFTGDICEVVLSLATWTTTERQQVVGYLAHKWGLAGNLPSDHPYKSVAP